MSSPLRISKLFFLSFFILYVMFADAAPTTDRLFMRDAGSASTDFQKQNGLDAQKLNAQYASLSTSDPCQTGSMACVNSSFAQCIGGKWTLTQCPAGLQCYALPLVNSPGTSLSCDTQTDALARIAASGVSGGLTGTNGTTTPPNNTPTTTGSDDDGDCTDDPPQSPPTGGNSTHTYGGSTTTNSTDAGADDCTDDDMTSSMKPMATPTPSGGKQLYRRQTPSGSSDRAAVNGNLEQAFPVTASLLPSASPSANSTGSILPTLSTSANTNATLPTQTAVTPLPTATSTNQTSVTTVTVIMVSTVTVTPSGCQMGVTTGLPSGSPTPPPSNSPTPAFTLSPSNISSSGIPTTTSLAVTSSSNSAISPPVPNVPSTLTPSSNSTANTNTNTWTSLATPISANSTPNQGGIAFSTQDSFVALPTHA